VLLAIVHALGQIGDKAAVDPLLERIGVNTVRWAIQQAVLAINDPGSVDKVRTIYARQKDPDSWENWHLRSLLRTLENRFPGN
jgi:HEAT repeat protein